jgi:hypothetical protein
MSKSLGAHKVEIHGGTNFNTTKLGHGVLCSHIYATLLAMGALHNITRKNDKPVMYVSKLLNSVEQNYSTIEREALTMVFALHKIRHYLLRNKCVFYVDHMAS